MHQSHLPPSSASPVSLSPGPSQRTSPVGSNLISVTISRTNAYLKRKNAMLHSSLSGAPRLDFFFFPFTSQLPPHPSPVHTSQGGDGQTGSGDSRQPVTEEENRARTSLPLRWLFMPSRPSSTTNPPSLLSSPLPPPSHLSSSGVTKGARCLVPENVPTYQKAPGLHVEAAQRRKRSR